MIIRTLDMQEAAVSDPRGDFTVRLGQDDPTITYEEYVVYFMCRYSSGYEYVDPDDEYRWWRRKSDLLDAEWHRLSASKTHKIEIAHSWDEIFPKYREEIGEEDFERFRKLSDKDLGPEGEIVDKTFK